MLARGLDVDVAAPELPVGSETRDLLEEMGVVVHDIPMSRIGTNPIKDLWLLWRVFVLMRRAQPDVVLGYTAKPVIYGSLAAWLSKVPHRYALITGLGYAFIGERGGSLTSLIRWLYGFALGKVHKVFFQNPDDEMFFRRSEIIKDHMPSVVVNGSGVDITVYAAVPLPEPPVRFLMIGRLLGDKGVREYVLAAQHIRATNPEVWFGLVGWIDEKPDAITQAELDTWIAEGSIEFLGRLEDVRPAIADSTVYVLPSYREGTPRTVLEAMAMGRPIITTDAPGCRETVVEGENGFLVPVKSVDGLIEAMRKFIDDPELAAVMGKRSREIAEEKYDVHKVNALMLREMGIT
jgi:glycosyltransferase involved in cell wall biosynthesis